MSDLDTLIVTFQTQLSDVMETVVKTAMHEVTRLVKDGFLEEMKRRSQEVMSLRLQLQWAEKKLTGQGGEEGEKTGRCVDCAQMDVELSSDTTEGRSKDQHNNVMRSCAVKIEGSSAERWTGDHRQEVISQEPQKADNPAATDSPEREPQATEEEDAMEEKDVIDKLPLSSSHLIGWSSTLDGSNQWGMRGCRHPEWQGGRAEAGQILPPSLISGERGERRGCLGRDKERERKRDKERVNGCTRRSERGLTGSAAKKSLGFCVGLPASGGPADDVTSDCDPSLVKIMRETYAGLRHQFDVAKGSHHLIRPRSTEVMHAD
ncbi:hypothetical protein INR49_022988, partial [Caranx melampygus]